MHFLKMSQSWKRVTVVSDPNNWRKNLPNNHGKSLYHRDGKTTVEITGFISKIVYLPWR